MRARGWRRSIGQRQQRQTMGCELCSYRRRYQGLEGGLRKLCAEADQPQDWHTRSTSQGCQCYAALSSCRCPRPRSPTAPCFPCPFRLPPACLHSCDHDSVSESDGYAVRVRLPARQLPERAAAGGSDSAGGAVGGVMAAAKMRMRTIPRWSGIQTWWACEKHRRQTGNEHRHAVNTSARGPDKHTHSHAPCCCRWCLWLT